MLSSNHNLTAYFIGSILDASHQEGSYPTQYSNIYDLNNCLIYLFHYHNFEEFIKIDLIKELNKGYRSFDIPEMFSKIKLLSPSNGENIKSTSVTFNWKGKPGSSYEVIYSTDPEFKDTSSIYLTYTLHRPGNSSGSLYYLPLLLLIIPLLKRKRIIYLPVVILFVVLSSSQCKKSETATPDIKVIEMTETISKLLPDTTYYWKIEAHANNQDDFHSETLTRHFNTGSSNEQF